MPRDPVFEATDEDLARFFRGAVVHDEWYGMCARRGKLVTAMGGVFRGPGGAFYGFLDIGAGQRGPHAYRHAKRFLKRISDAGVDVVRTTCDESIPRAREFLERLGFIETDELLDGKVMWECQVSRR